MKGFIAERGLLEEGFSVFHPKVREEKRWSRGRTHESIKPLITGYMFVLFDSEVEGWQRINSVKGVIGLMYSAFEKPARVPDRAMLPLLGMCVDGYVPKAEAQRFIFKAGQAVRVVEGPFASFPGLVDRATASMVRVNVIIFGRSTPIEGEPAMFEPVA